MYLCFSIKECIVLWLDLEINELFYVNNRWGLATVTPSVNNIPIDSRVHLESSTLLYFFLKTEKAQQKCISSVTEQINKSTWPEFEFVLSLDDSLRWYHDITVREGWCHSIQYYQNNIIKIQHYKSILSQYVNIYSENQEKVGCHSCTRWWVVWNQDCKHVGFTSWTDVKLTHNLRQPNRHNIEPFSSQPSWPRRSQT